jgi:hypothetical protein
MKKKKKKREEEKRGGLPYRACLGCGSGGRSSGRLERRKSTAEKVRWSVIGLFDASSLVEQPISEGKTAPFPLEK